MNISWNNADFKNPFYASVALSKRDRIQCSMFTFWSWSGWLSRRLNQFPFTCGLELYCRNTKKFSNILSKIVWKKFNRHLWLIGGIFQYILPLFMKKNPFCTILTLKGQHEYHFCAKFQGYFKLDIPTR